MPFSSQLHTDKLLSNIAVKYRPADKIIMDLIPALPVKKDSDLYRIYTRNFRIPETERSSRGLAHERQFQVTTSTYQLRHHALKDYVSAEDKENFDAGDLRADTTEDLMDTVMQRMELVGSNLFTTTSWSQNVSLAAANAWNANTTLSDPIPIWDTGATTIIHNSGKMPNKAAIGRDAFVAMKNHVSILDRVKYTSSELTKVKLQGLIDVQKLLCALASQDTSAEGQADVIAQMWGDVAFLGFLPDSVSRSKPSAAVMFKKNRPSVRRWNEPSRGPNGSEAIEVNESFDIKVVASLCGYLIKDVV